MTSSVYSYLIIIICLHSYGIQFQVFLSNTNNASPERNTVCLTQDIPFGVRLTPMQVMLSVYPKLRRKAGVAGILVPLFNGISIFVPKPSL